MKYYFLGILERDEGLFIIDRFYADWLPLTLAYYFETTIQRVLPFPNKKIFQLYHFLEGLISGIPICCIIQYMRGKGICLLEVQYKPCPYCFRKKRYMKNIFKVYYKAKVKGKLRL